MWKSASSPRNNENSLSCRWRQFYFGTSNFDSHNDIDLNIVTPTSTSRRDQVDVGGPSTSANQNKSCETFQTHVLIFLKWKICFSLTPNPSFIQRRIHHECNLANLSYLNAWGVRGWETQKCGLVKKLICYITRNKISAPGNVAENLKFLGLESDFYMELWVFGAVSKIWGKNQQPKNHLKFLTKTVQKFNIGLFAPRIFDDSWLNQCRI